jgi:hypothetical protein
MKARQRMWNLRPITRQEKTHGQAIRLNSGVMLRPPRLHARPRLASLRELVAGHRELPSRHVHRLTEHSTPYLVVGLRTRSASALAVASLCSRGSCLDQLKDWQGSGNGHPLGGTWATMASQAVVSSALAPACVAGGEEAAIRIEGQAVH